MVNQIYEYFINNWLAIITMGLTIIWLFLEYKANIWLWPIGIILPLFWIIVSIEGKVYGNVIINAYYFITSIIGWYMWLNSKKEHNQENVISSISIKNTIISIIITIPSIIISYYLLSHFTDSKYPYLDAIATIVSFVGMIWLSKKWWQHWICWIIANVIYSITFMLMGDKISTITFIISTIVAILGIPKWINLMNKNKYEAL